MRAEFEALTGHPPFPWQEALFREMRAGRIPSSCCIPTGLGKTSVIALWLLALAHRSADKSGGLFPRRLIYVVNRRTVVDQATREVESMRAALLKSARLSDVASALRDLVASASDAPLAISTLRGQFADNAEWRTDPARATVIIGTVDMIGSRLLFGGYSCGFKSRPFHAGIIGQDSLIVHDEAHLEPAFQILLSAIAEEQRRCLDIRPIRVLEMTATSRDAAPAFGISAADLEHAVARQRLTARKRLRCFGVESAKEIAEEVASRALLHRESGQAILVFMRRLDDLRRVESRLSSEGLVLQTLTGTMRGRERDLLVQSDDVYARFMAKPPELVPRAGTVYLLCTSAGEVGVDLSADHLISDLTPFDSMAQRLGRVNRLGSGNAQVDVVHAVVAAANRTEEDADAAAERDPYVRALDRTRTLLDSLPRSKDGSVDASPRALGRLPVDRRVAAYAPPPVVLPVSDILFDNWALTTLRGGLPGRPPIADWLHGLSGWEPPEVQVAWREEVELLSEVDLSVLDPGELLEDYPLKPHETLKERVDRALGEFGRLAARHRAARAWVVASDGGLRSMSLADLAQLPERELHSATVLLPPSVGGLRSGMLSGDSDAGDESLDVADNMLDAAGSRLRQRLWDKDEPEPGMRLVLSLDMAPERNDSTDQPIEYGESSAATRRYWRWYVRPRLADDEGSRVARDQQLLDPHLRSAEANARRIVAKLGLSRGEATAVVAASRWHDLGKARKVWQRSIGNADYPAQVLAKSGGQARLLDLNHYRHEFGSILDVAELSEFRSLGGEERDLVLHLIAAHHGRARPGFPTAEAFDPDRPDDHAALAAREVPRRFGRLQRRYGRWGLAFLESLVRAADVQASQALDPSVISRSSASRSRGAKGGDR